jgi:tRNA-dihydrouridine synthase B
MRDATGAAGIMIGRGAFGQPWIFRQAKALLAGEPMPASPTVEERFAIALEHAAMVKAYEPDPRGAAIEFRKHLGWYAKGLFNAAALKQRLFAVTHLDEIEGIFADYLAQGHAERTGAQDDAAATLDEAAA